MNKVSSDFSALRAALKREREKLKELGLALGSERDKVASLEAALEGEKQRAVRMSESFDRERTAARNRLDESECFAKKQIEALNAERENCDGYKRQIEYLKGDGLWELVRDNQDIKKRIICEYLKGIPSGVSLVGSTGYAALTPIHKPQNLADAKRIAEKIIKA